MRIHIIACRVFTRELCFYAARSPHIVDITWLPQGLHDTPVQLQKMISDSLDQLYIQMEKKMVKHKPDVIVLGYGLCSNGIVGITSRDIPIVVPRTDDCIALFLGSQKRYLELFKDCGGTYWLNNGWIEKAFIPSREMLNSRYEEYIKLYGEENAEFLAEQDQCWIRNYNACGYISSPAYHCPEYPELARRVADENGWNYREFEGDNRMLRMMVSGLWNDEEFCICPPFHRIEATCDDKKIRAVPCE